MLQRSFARWFIRPRELSPRKPNPTDGPISLPVRSLSQALDEQTGSDVSIQKTPALSSALHNYFDDRNVALDVAVTELLSFCSPLQLKQINDDIVSLGSRGVALESSPVTFFRFGAPALGRYLNNFGIDLKGDKAAEFILNFGRAVKYTLAQLPSYLMEAVEGEQLTNIALALKQFFIFTAEGGRMISPRNITNSINLVASPLHDREFCEQLAYELETLMYLTLRQH